MILVISRFGFEGWGWVLIASVPDLCIRFTFTKLIRNALQQCSWISALYSSNYIRECDSHGDPDVRALACLKGDLYYAAPVSKKNTICSKIFSFCPHDLQHLHLSKNFESSTDAHLF